MAKSLDPVDSKFEPVINVRKKTTMKLTVLNRGVLNDKDLGPVLYYHYYPLATKQAGGDADGVNSGYKFSWNQLTFTDGWPVVSA